MGITTCDYCKEEIIRKDSQIKRSKNHFCCKQHHDLFQQKQNNIVIKENYAEMIIKDKIVLIDIEDIKKVNQYKWNISNSKNKKEIYIRAWERNKTEKNRNVIKLHRFLMNCPENMEIDHINRNTLDNRKCNLRIVKQSENAQNKGFYQNNKSGYKYIYWNKSYKRWAVQIRRNNILKRIGYFKNLIKAIQVRNEYCKENKICLN